MIGVDLTLGLTLKSSLNRDRPWFPSIFPVYRLLRSNRG